MTLSYPAYASVLLDAAVDTPFDYGIPPPLLPLCAPGTHVEVPVRGSLRRGYICSIQQTASVARVKPIHRLLSKTPLLPNDLFALARWIAHYYCTPIGQVLRIMLPSPIRKETSHKTQLFVRRAQPRKDLIEWLHHHRSRSPKQAEVLDILLPVDSGMLLSELLERSKATRSTIDSLAKKNLVTLRPILIDRSPLTNAEYLPSLPKRLNSEQSAALQCITSSLDAQKFETHLLYGITGSGKTEVYLQAIAHARKAGLTVLVLVPEIALTIHTIEAFRRRFGDAIAVLHHRLSTGERFDTWHKIQKGEAPIVIGARSAIFAPLPHLGLIIVDEEHENSYKQSEEPPCYHARDVAVMRGKMGNATVVLGSATPSLETYRNADQGKYTLSTLTRRAETASRPQVEIIDMRKEYEKAHGFTHFSQPLLNGLQKRIEKGEKAILFLNRRGYHTALLCTACQEVCRCPHCALALTYHKKNETLDCHLCGYRLSPPPRECPSCHAEATLRFRGAGTEQIERSLHAIFPEIRTLRIDADTTRHKGSHERLFRAFATGKADVLIGTQMIAKGLHFPEVTLAAVLNSDATLQLPDFRASELAFQLITQVAGRAGRGFLPGEVLIQTNSPDNPTIRWGADQNYTKFYETEIASREMFTFPPFSQMVKLVFSSKKEEVAERNGNLVRTTLGKLLPTRYRIFPVAPCGYAKIKDLFRFQCLLTAPSLKEFPNAMRQVQKQGLPKEGCRMLIDVNPTSTY